MIPSRPAPPAPPSLHALATPPRLFVIMAARAPRAVILRRGPASWVQLVLWDTLCDLFTPGAWFRGRIYEEKCDLSPDGELFLYAALQGRRLRSDYSHAWTALSRPPWLHALVLWPMHTTYGGGGRFVGNRQLIVRGASKTHPAHPLHGVELVRGEAPYHQSSGEVEGAQWSGRDQQNRLVFTRDGRVFVRTAGQDRELADFTASRPDPQPPPAVAKRALSALRATHSK